ncbi:MAG: DUF2961 domain-containing protein [Vicinamibacterales bacterium]|nr:DUF2961 domain-containing protein [Vicinamibacterales bacterium]MDP6607633.1 DUF2961 domain-containing protein [Vicinamibacterales bacterium]|tara:strand:- start:3330 stop:4571 length:1242 start_codon:yes stop_codon:yes gene_type:complete
MLKNALRRRFMGGMLGMGGAAAAMSAVGAPAFAQERQGRGQVNTPGGLAGLFLARQGRRRRESSWNRDGRNADRYQIEPGATHVMADLQGAGIIRHIWVTINHQEPDYLRKLVLRAYWDGQSEPSVEAPIGDFFGVGHGRVSNYWSLPLNMVTGGGPESQNRAAMNCFFPMAFGNGARITVENQGDEPTLALYYYVDYESFDSMIDEALRFHAQWRRVNPTSPRLDLSNRVNDFPRTNEEVNLDGNGNYTVLEATGRGHYVGCNLSIDHLNPIPNFNWFGEGDDFFWIDGEATPSLMGTGTEDYFCAAWGYPGGFNSMPYHGISYPVAPEEGPERYSGKWTMYRYHVEDPIMFQRSLKFSIEAGHANVHANDYSSVAYWYQTLPHQAFPGLLPVAQRVPIPDRESQRSFWRTF